jgi:hypothetical protein
LAFAVHPPSLAFLLQLLLTSRLSQVNDRVMLSNGLPARVTSVGEQEVTLDLNHEVRGYVCAMLGTCVTDECCCYRRACWLASRPFIIIISDLTAFCPSTFATLPAATHLHMADPLTHSFASPSPHSQHRVTCRSAFACLCACNPLQLAGKHLTFDVELLTLTAQDSLQKATFGAGCFWGPELAFQRVAGAHIRRGIVTLWGV